MRRQKQRVVDRRRQHNDKKTPFRSQQPRQPANDRTTVGDVVDRLF